MLESNSLCWFVGFLCFFLFSKPKNPPPPFRETTTSPWPTVGLYTQILVMHWRVELKSLCTAEQKCLKYMNVLEARLEETWLGNTSGLRRAVYETPWCECDSKLQLRGEPLFETSPLLSPSVSAGAFSPFDQMVLVVPSNMLFYDLPVFFHLLIWNTPFTVKNEDILHNPSHNDNIN